MCDSLISINNCRIQNHHSTFVQNISWTMKKDQFWLVIGPNGGGKADFFNALSSSLHLVPNQNGSFTNAFQDSTEIVSLERAAKLIQEERENDESDYVEGGVDIGRTVRVFLAECLVPVLKKGEPLPAEANELDSNQIVSLCGVQSILDRGLKFLSTGEIRRTLLARALLSKKQLLLLSDPFAGLDQQSRTLIFDFINNLLTNPNNNSDLPHIILGMERWHEIPDGITHVLEFSQKEISFSGTKDEYIALRKERESQNQQNLEETKTQLSQNLEQTFQNTKVLQNPQPENSSSQDEYLIQMKNVNIGWGDNHVLVDFNWELKKGEHWLIQGPNGSGKTTFLELITGDNRQVFCNDIKIFGKPRGSGETIWDIKKQLGIVSYRLHVEYRMLGGTSLLSTILSGFKDSIGLYEQPSGMEIDAAKMWLKLGGFENREKETFGSLSYGEQRALLILRSAVKNPKILILDEPCHGLDEKQREKVITIMEEIGKRNTTSILHVTHDPSETLSCEKHILQLLPGQKPMYCIKNLTD